MKHLQLEGPYGAATFKVASPRQWDAFLRALDGPAKHEAVARLLIGCCVSPGPVGLQQLFDERPGLAHAFGNEFVRFCGLDDVKSKIVERSPIARRRGGGR